MPQLMLFALVAHLFLMTSSLHAAGVGVEGSGLTGTATETHHANEHTSDSPVPNHKQEHCSVEPGTTATRTSVAPVVAYFVTVPACLMAFGMVHLGGTPEGSTGPPWAIDTQAFLQVFLN